MIGELINCMARTHGGRCAMCAVCRIVMAIENLTVDVDSDRMARHLDRIADSAEQIEELLGDL